MTRGWAEKQRLGDLPAYAKTAASDLCQFSSFDDEAKLLINHGETAKIRPLANSQWFANAGKEVLGLISRMQRVGVFPNKELSSTLADLGILANLALYHSRRIPAAVYYRLYEHTHDITALDSAIAYENRAIQAWRQLVISAGDFYTDNLQMGVRVAGLCGHWKDELAALEAGLVRLKEDRQQADPHAMTAKAPQYTFSPTPSFDALFHVHLLAPDSIPVGQAVPIRIIVTAPSGMKWVRLFYRAMNQQLEYKNLPMESGGKPNEFHATIPAGDIDPTYDLLYYVELMDKNGQGNIFPDLNKETPYRVLKLIRWR